jgi:exoribonuclease R
MAGCYEHYWLYNEGMADSKEKGLTSFNLNDPRWKKHGRGLHSVPAASGGGSSSEGLQSAERLSYHDTEYVVGEIELRGTKRQYKVLVIPAAKGGKARVLDEKQLTFLGDPQYKVGHVLALEKPVGDRYLDLAPLQDLGEKGEWRTETARVAYLVGNGEISRQAIAEIEQQIEAKGPRLVSEELERLEAMDGGLVNLDDRESFSKFRHGRSRVDWRKAKDVRIVTIDPESARDHDDAVHARRINVDGKWYVEIGVHIADVSHFVPIDKNDSRGWYPLLENAVDKAQTLYSPRKAFHMQPRVLSEQLCSLKHGEDRLAVSTVFYVDEKTGGVVDVWHGKSVMKSEQHHSYEDAQRILGNSSPDASQREKRLRADLRMLDRFARKFRAVRENRKEVNFPESQELEVVRNEAGEEVPGVQKPLETKKLIQDLMIATNEARALTLMNKCLENPKLFFAVFRFHDPPTLEKLRRMAETWGPEGMVQRIDNHAKDPNKQVQEPGSKEPPFVNQIVWELMQYAQKAELPPASRARSEREMRDAMAKDPKHALHKGTEAETTAHIEHLFIDAQKNYRAILTAKVMSLFGKAKYTTDPKAHFGLAALPYGTFTSPIRRVEDILNDHFLQAALADDPSLTGDLTLEALSKMVDHFNGREKIIDAAQELTKNIWGAGLFKSLKTAENPYPEIHDVEIISAPLGEGKKTERIVEVRMRHPSGPYFFTFEVPITDFIGFPENPDAAHELLRKPVTVRFVDADVASGTVQLELASAKKSVSRRERVRPEMIETMKQLHQIDLEKLATEFEDVFTDEKNKFARKALEKLRTDVANITTTTPGNTVDLLGARIRSLRLIIERTSGLSLQELLARRGRAPVRPSPGVSLPSEPAPRAGSPASIAEDRAARIARLRAEIAETLKLKEIEELERKIQEARSRKK